MARICWCCVHDIDVDEALYVASTWEGRLDGYCRDCASARCDAYPGECPRQRES